MLKIFAIALFTVGFTFVGLAPVPVDCEKLAEKILLENRSENEMEINHLLVEFDLVVFDGETYEQIKRIKNKNVQFKAKVELFKNYLETKKYNTWICANSLAN